jgi:hypothetical protein
MQISILTVFSLSLIIESIFYVISLRVHVYSTIWLNKSDISVMNGPIKLNTSEIIFDVFKYLEDITMGIREKT